MNAELQKQRYGKIDGLRTFAAVGIVLMHVQANLNRIFEGFAFERLIPSFTDLVFLFMMISGFSVCCGYFEGITTGKITLGQFYKKRFVKVWPFFALMCLLELIVSPSIETLYEVLANLTLCFGFIPNHGIEVIGVGWFLGVSFVFYFLFPFFCYLLSEKKRAWCALGVALLLNYLCENYFGAGRASIAYSAVFFLLGGMVYLYRVPLQRFAERFGSLVVLGIAGVAALYYIYGPHVLTMLMQYGLMLIFALRGKHCKVDLLQNPVTKLLSSVSMEIYLSHMVIFRGLEIIILGKLQGLRSELLYAVMATATLIGTAIFSYICQKFLIALPKWVKLKKHTVGDALNV